MLFIALSGLAKVDYLYNLLYAIPMNPDIHTNANPIIKRYSLKEFSGNKFVNAIINKIRQRTHTVGAKIQKSFVMDTIN